MNGVAAELKECYVGQGYFIQNFLRKMTEEEFGFEEEFIGGEMVELELITTPDIQYDDWRKNPTYEELMTGFGPF